MRIVNLIEDMPSDNVCKNEHGLSFYIETEHHKILVDTGATDAFLSNAELLGINLSKVDTVILSHGHYDHCGGVMAFAKINENAKIYVRENAFLEYYHLQKENARYIGCNKEIESLGQVIKIKGDLVIDKELSVFTNVRGKRLWPAGNKELMQKIGEDYVRDEFLHEQYLVISLGDGEEETEILISGCAHNGILNILDTYKERRGHYPNVVISGFHMMKKSGYSEEDYEIIKETASELTKIDCKFYTCHCTGTEPFEIMKEIMGGQIEYVKCADEIKCSF